MTAATAIREQVRMLAIEIGEKRAAEQLGIEYATVRQWSHRYAWKRPTLSTQQPVTVVTESPAKVLTDELADHEHKTRLTLAKYVKNAAGAIHKSVHPAKWTKEANDLAKTMAIVHRQDEQKGQGFTLNVLNMGSLAVTVDQDEA